MEYPIKKMKCEKHGLAEFVKEWNGWMCEECMGEDMEGNIQENIRIIEELNLNGVGL